MAAEQETFGLRDGQKARELHAKAREFNDLLAEAARSGLRIDLEAAEGSVVERGGVRNYMVFPRVTVRVYREVVADGPANEAEDGGD